MRCRHAGIFRDFSIRDRLRCTASDLGADGGIGRSQCVVFQAKQRPPCHGTSASPSGRLSSPGSKPDGSLTDGVSALRSARQARSLICWWRMERPALRLHESPCIMPVKHDMRGVGVVTRGGIAAGEDAAGGEQRRHGPKGRS